MRKEQIKKQNLIIEYDFAQKLLDYLVQKPYIEVAPFVQGLLNLKPYQEKNNNNL